tara:strand:- start:592 stop:1233 length:642 start_codon:yes stop_codon:yes gene_type:complete
MDAQERDYPFFSSEGLPDRYSDSLIDELTPMLNSQRILRLFGTYGIEVLYQNDKFRISNLYSSDEDKNTMRTCAFVNFCNPVAPSLLDTHRSIVAGSSMGATLAKNGFKIIKTPIFFGESNLPTEIKTQMNVESASCAVHVYKMSVLNQNESVVNDYCIISEVHSPSYITCNTLARIYPEEYIRHNQMNEQAKEQLENIENIDVLVKNIGYTL